MPGMDTGGQERTESEFRALFAAAAFPFKVEGAANLCLRVYIHTGGSAYGVAPINGYGIQKVEITSATADCTSSIGKLPKMKKPVGLECPPIGVAGCCAASICKVACSRA